MHYDALRNEFYNPAHPNSRDHRSVLQFAAKRKNIKENYQKQFSLFKLRDVARMKQA